MAAWLLALGLAVWIWGTLQDQRERIDGLQADMKEIEDYLPCLLRLELAEHERRMVLRIEEIVRR